MLRIPAPLFVRTPYLYPMFRRYLDSQNDIAFKHTFDSEKNEDILLALLNSVLKKQIHLPIKEATLLPQVKNPATDRRYQAMARQVEE